MTDVSLLASMTVAELMQARDVPTSPFCMRLVADSGAKLPDPVTVECREILRWMPGRRLVAKASVDGQDCVLKLFMGPGARRYRDREHRGLRCISRCGVPTPRVLGSLEVVGEDAEVPASGVLLEWLPDARPIAATDSPAFVRVVTVLAQLHRHGVVQTDPHLGNYLEVAGRGIHALDGDGVRRWRVLPRTVALANLGLLLAQRPLAEDVHLDEACAEYARARWQTTVTDRLALDVSRHLGRQRRTRARRYLRKTLRACREFHCEKTSGQFISCVRDAWNEHMAAFAADPEDWFAHARVLKGGNSATVISTRVGGRPYVVKRYNIKGVVHGLRRAAQRVPRYRRSWLNGHRFMLLGLPTARPVMLLERRSRWLATTGYLVMEDLSGPSGHVDDLAVVARRGELSTQLVEQVVALFRGLADAGLAHRDTKASNFIICGDVVHLVDLDAMGESRRGVARDITRFLENWRDAPALQGQFRRALQAAGIGL